jgi:hypothetical protein
MKPDEATLRTKIEQAISGLATSKGYLDDLSKKPEPDQKQARLIFRKQVESVIENLEDLTEAVEKNKGI